MHWKPDVFLFHIFQPSMSANVLKTSQGLGCPQISFKKCPQMAPTMTHFWYHLGAKFMFWGVSKLKQKQSLKKKHTKIIPKLFVNLKKMPFFFFDKIAFHHKTGPGPGPGPCPGPSRPGPSPSQDKLNIQKIQTRRSL